MSTIMAAMEAFMASPLPEIKEQPQTMSRLAALPNEILTSIFHNLSQISLCALMSQNKNIHDLVAPSLYRSPTFASTYRFGQFSLAIGSNPILANLVHNLDLSYFEPPSPPPTSDSDSSDSEVDDEAHVPPQAGWRELRGIDAPLYHIYRRERCAPPFDYCKVPQNWMTVSWNTMRDMERRGELGRELYSPLGSFRKSSHPPPSPELRLYRKVRDLPIGVLVRVLAACHQLITVDLSRLQLAKECYLVLNSDESKDSISLTSPFASYIPFTFSSSSQTPSTSTFSSSYSKTPAVISTATLSPLTHAFSTDTPEPHRFIYDLPGPGKNEFAVYPDDIVYWLAQLKNLHTLKIRQCSWFTTARAWLLFCGLDRVTRTVAQDDSHGKGKAKWKEIEMGEKEEDGEKGMLRDVDFTASGLRCDSTSAWKVRGEPGTVYRDLEEIVRGEGIEYEERCRRGLC